MNQMEAYLLRESLRECNCKYSDGGRPFFFHPDEQKVMIISLSPTFQAVYRPLSSIRFFRVLCLALLGQNPDINENCVTETFFKNYYWTHYHKCYFDYWNNHSKKDIPRNCADKYLMKEIEILKPSLILVLGDLPIKRILGLDISANKGDGTAFIQGDNFTFDGIEINIPYIAANFPSLDNINEFAPIRAALKKYVECIDDIEVDKPYVDTPSFKGKVGTHALFELNALEVYWKEIKNTKPTVGINNLNEYWHVKDLVPRIKVYNFIITTYSFMEQQVKVLAYDKKISLRKDNTFKSIRELLYEILDKEQLKGKKRDEVNQVIEDIENLRRLRNCLIHNGGLWEMSDELKDFTYNSDYEKFVSIKITFNYLEFDERGCENALYLAKDLVFILNDLKP